MIGAAAALRRRRVAFLRPPFLRAPFFRPPLRRVAFLRPPFLRPPFLRVPFLRAAILGHPPVACLERGLALHGSSATAPRVQRVSDDRSGHLCVGRKGKPLCSCPLSDPGTCNLTADQPVPVANRGSRATLAAHANTRFSSSSSKKHKKNNAMGTKAAGRGTSSGRFARAQRALGGWEAVGRTERGACLSRPTRGAGELALSLVARALKQLLLLVLSHLLAALLDHAAHSDTSAAETRDDV